MNWITIPWVAFATILVALIARGVKIWVSGIQYGNDHGPSFPRKRAGCWKRATPNGHGIDSECGVRSSRCDSAASANRQNHLYVTHIQPERYAMFRAALH